MIEEKYSFNVNKMTIEKNGRFFAYLNSIDAYKIVEELNNLHEENKAHFRDIRRLEEQEKRLYEDNVELKEAMKRMMIEMMSR